MFNLSVLEGFKTVGSIIQYKDTFAFVIGPDNTDERLGIMRLGGHIEADEGLLQTLEREIMEEGSIEVKLLSSPNTFYKKNWDDNDYYEISQDFEMDIKPIIIVGDSSRSTAVFLSYAEKEPKPSSEVYGIIFLRENDIRDICTKKLRLQDFLNNGGKLIQQKEIDYDMEMYAGVHLTFLNRLMEDKNDLVHRCFKKPRNHSAAGVLLLNENNKVLLQHRTDSDTWGIPGGGLNIGESLEDAARREVFEETNLTVGKMELFNVFSGKEQHWIYPDGNEVYIVNVVFISRDYHGIIKADGVESKELKYFDINDLPELISTNIPILNDLRKRIDKL